jgi:DNA-binding IscR family transcriptional regulator
MRITTKGHSAVTALVDIATRGGNTPVTLWGISERQKISVGALKNQVQQFSERMLHGKKLQSVEY